MSRCLLFLLSALVVSAMSVGCCGPRCGVTSCNDCDGIGYGQQPIPQRPLAALRNGSLFCGSGCGEVYVDEWLSNPPECSDPCAGADWVGGSSCGGSSCGSSCGGCCWQPGDLFRRFSLVLLGGRCCTGAQSSADCGCGCGSCGGGRLLGSGLLGSGLLGGRSCGSAGSTSSCGCGGGSCGGSTVEYSSPGGYVPAASSSCGCSSASASPVGTHITQTASRSTHTASRFATPKRDGLTKNY